MCTGFRCCPFTLLQPGRSNASGEPSGLAAPLPHALPAPGASVATGGMGTHPVYFNAAATMKLSEVLSMMKGLKVRGGVELDEGVGWMKV